MLLTRAYFRDRAHITITLKHTKEWQEATYGEWPYDLHVNQHWPHFATAHDWYPSLKLAPDTQTEILTIHVF